MADTWVETSRREGSISRFAKAYEVASNAFKTAFGKSILDSEEFRQKFEGFVALAFVEAKETEIPLSIVHHETTLAAAALSLAKQAQDKGTVFWPSAQSQDPEDKALRAIHNIRKEIAEVATQSERALQTGL